MWRKYGAMPEFYNLGQQDCMQGREGYPLRPGRNIILQMSETFFYFIEHIESIMYLSKATNDDIFLFMAADIFDAIESCCKTTCGYTSVNENSL
jgi:hypothetical protein